MPTDQATQATDKPKRALRYLRGSLTNRLLEVSTMPKPTVGMDATECWYSDRKAGRIVKVSPSGKSVWFVRDIATKADSVPYGNNWRYQPGNGLAYEYTLRVNGCWIMKGNSAKSGTSLILGVKDHYFDHEF